MDDRKLKALTQFLSTRVGLVFDLDSQRYSLEKRWKTVVTVLGQPESEILQKFEKKSFSEFEIQKIIDSVTNNETYFFRDQFLFELLTEIYSQKNISSRIRILHAACSTGQEVYSNLILLKDEFPQLFDKIAVEAFDINESNLEQSKGGIYSDFELSRGVSKEIKEKYFQHKENVWQVSPEIRKKVVFSKKNLLDFELSGTYEVIFLRNVLIYFEKPIKEKIIDVIEKSMCPGGILLLGNGEKISRSGLIELNFSGYSYYQKSS